MIADILYPIFTLKITVLAYLIQKNRGPRPHQSITMDALVGYSSPNTPSCRKNDAPIFSLDYPLIILNKIVVFRLSCCGFKFKDLHYKHIKDDILSSLSSYPKVKMPSEMVKEFVTALHFIA